MTLSERLKSPFPFYLNDDRKNILLILAISLFVVAFLHLYRPYFNRHVELTIGHKFLFGGVTFVVLFFDIIILPRLFPKAFDATTWTIGKYSMLTLLHLILIGIASTILDETYICPEKTLIDNIIGANIQVAMTGVIPVTIIFLFLKTNMLQQNLKGALSANRELEKIKNLKKEVPVKNTTSAPITLHSDTSETLDLHLPDLLFVEADDNYSTVFWKNGHGIQKKLLRVNLKNIESQINNSFTIRCHRSYIVNVNAISNISGNTNGYKLQILDTDLFIPVSRPKGKEVIEKIQQLRNVMELA
ncbi:MAG TPA: LytTR family DNA-binding domain-containing protein [Ohtaekwangia sp.]